MFRRVIAGLILGPALLIGSFAWSGYLALGTIFDENRSATVAQELLDNEKVKAQVAANIAGAISSALPDGTPVTEEQVDAAALAVLNDGRITGLVINSLGETHRSFLGLNDVPQTVDLNPAAELGAQRRDLSRQALHHQCPSIRPVGGEGGHPLLASPALSQGRSSHGSCDRHGA